jgi:hypothetical protein
LKLKGYLEYSDSASFAAAGDIWLVTQISGEAAYFFSRVNGIVLLLRIFWKQWVRISAPMDIWCCGSFCLNPWESLPFSHLSLFGGDVSFQLYS